MISSNKIKSDSCQVCADDRIQQLLNEALVWVSEHCPSDEDLYIALHQNIGLSDEEIFAFGFESLLK